MEPTNSIQKGKISPRSFAWICRGLFRALSIFFLSFQSLIAQSLFTVNSIEDYEDIDLADTICADKNGMCTLRAALQNAKKVNEKTKVHFDIEGCGPFTIILKDNLPKITSPIDLDASTQPGYSKHAPQLILDGSKVFIKMVRYNVEKGMIGLNLFHGSDGSSIKGFGIGGFRGVGIFVHSDNNVIQQNFIGTNPEGDRSFRNTTGIFLKGKNNLIGGFEAKDRNVVSGNGIGFAVHSSNKIIGNYIGTTVYGNSALANEVGVTLVHYSKYNLIYGNLISGNKTGLDILGDYNEVYANKIGANSSATSKIKNEIGVRLSIGRFNKIGRKNHGNLISGNNYGIVFQNPPHAFYRGNNEVKGNLIGVDSTGMNSLANEIGIQINGSWNDLIGGASIGDQNVISGNFGPGIEVNNARESLIQGNYIGTDASGLISVSNGVGIRFSESSIDLITAESTVANNLISGNLDNGIEIHGFGQHALIGNFIGTLKDGITPLANCGNGITILNTAMLDCIGGFGEDMPNIIAYNSGNGIHILTRSDNSESMEMLSRANQIGKNLGLDFFIESENTTLANK